MVEEQVGVPGDGDVGVEGVRDVRVDVVLRRTGGVVGRGFLAVDGAPREECSGAAHFAGATTSLGQHPDPMHEQAACHRGRCVDQEGQQVGLGVPEVVAVVPRARQALGRHAVPLAPQGRLEHREQVEVEGLLRCAAALPDHLAALPEVRHRELVL